ncbi:MAG: competence protein CoiA family protein [Syntrophobacteraceae bacterium]
MDDDSLKVPFAINEDGQEVRPEAPDKEDNYFCPDCKLELFWRKGEIKRPHFAHKVIPKTCDFLSETEEHYRAKLTLLEAVYSGKPVKFLRVCKQCKKETVEQAFPSHVTKASLEFLLPSGHRADVALFDKAERLLAVIEIMVTHSVDEEKMKALRGIPWAEFTAETILSSTAWKAERDFFLGCTCLRCKLINRYGAVYQLVGDHKTLVHCPSVNSLVDAIPNCAMCDSFIDVRRMGIFCIGSYKNETSR